MADELILELVTPDKLAFSGPIEEVTIPGTEGEFGVLRGHASLLSSIEIGALSYTKDGKKTRYAVNTGYAEILPSKVTVLVESAESADTIDKDRALKAKEAAEGKLAKLDKDDPEYGLVKAALTRAETRLKVLERE
jgi:F-type H+-transporting ATPase subunit epsilon